jgi:hypothetical protein
MLPMSSQVQSPRRSEMLTRILRWPLIIAAIVVVLRVVVERAGASDAVANILSVVALHSVIGPVYFAILIARSTEPRPYIMLLKAVALYALLTRIMLLPTYWLGRIFEWPQNRFAGLAGSSPFIGYIAIPFGTAAFWIVASLVFGGVVGSIIIAITRRLASPR